MKNVDIGQLLSSLKKKQIQRIREPRPYRDWRRYVYTFAALLFVVVCVHYYLFVSLGDATNSETASTTAAHTLNARDLNRLLARIRTTSDKPTPTTLPATSTATSTSL